MKVKIQIEFEVLDVDDESVARSAASLAAYDYLTFCQVFGVNSTTDEVTVVVDGHGECRVRLGEEHE